MRKYLVILLVLAFPPLLFAATTYNKMVSGSKTVTTPGTAVHLTSTSTGCSVVYITATHEVSHDVGSVYIGDSSVSAGGAWGTVKAKAGIVALSDDVIALPISDVYNVYVDSAHTADGVSFLYFQ